jgi:hypothetical protein
MISYGSEGSQVSQDWEAARQRLDSLAANMKQVLFPIVGVTRNEILRIWKIYSNENLKVLVNFREVIHGKEVLSEGDFKSQARSSWLKAKELHQSCSGTEGTVRYWSTVTGVTEDEVYSVCALSEDELGWIHSVKDAVAGIAKVQDKEFVETGLLVPTSQEIKDLCDSTQFEVSQIEEDINALEQSNISKSSDQFRGKIEEIHDRVQKLIWQEIGCFDDQITILKKVVWRKAQQEETQTEELKRLRPADADRILCELIGARELATQIAETRRMLDALDARVNAFLRTGQRKGHHP